MVSPSNLSILERNCLHAFEGAATSEASCRVGEQAFLRGAAREVLKAERAGYAAIALHDALRPMIDRAAAAFAGPTCSAERTAGDVMGFVLERNYRRFFPDGRAN